MVRDPAGEREAARRDRLARQQRVVEATEAHAHDEHHGKSEARGKLRGVDAAAERHAKAADALHDHDVRPRRQLVERVHDAVEIDRDVPARAAAMCGAIGGSKQ